VLVADGKDDALSRLFGDDQIVWQVVEVDGNPMLGNDIWWLFFVVVATEHHQMDAVDRFLGGCEQQIEVG
jgi:hypothetical protein